MGVCRERTLVQLVKVQCREVIGELNEPVVATGVQKTSPERVMFRVELGGRLGVGTVSQESGERKSKHL